METAPDRPRTVREGERVVDIRMRSKSPPEAGAVPGNVAVVNTATAAVPADIKERKK